MKSRGPGRLIIHCGVQKTASTAFHHFLRRNHATLSQYLEIRTPTKASPTRELGRISALYSLDDSHEVALLAHLTGLRDDLLGSDRPCLVSHENIPGAMLGRDGVVTLYPAIDRILRLFDEQLAPFEPEYVFYTRDLTRWKRSVHNQSVRSDLNSATYEQFLTDTQDCGDWADLQARVEAVVGADRCHFLRLEDEPHKGRPGQQLLRLCGVPEDVLEGLDPVQGNRNPSLNAGALEFLRQVNALDLPIKPRTAIADLVLENQGLFVTETGGA